MRIAFRGTARRKDPDFKRITLRAPLAAATRTERDITTQQTFQSGGKSGYHTLCLDKRIPLVGEQSDDAIRTTDMPASHNNHYILPEMQ